MTFRRLMTAGLIAAGTLTAATLSTAAQAQNVTGPTVDDRIQQLIGPHQTSANKGTLLPYKSGAESAARSQGIAGKVALGNEGSFNGQTLRLYVYYYDQPVAANADDFTKGKQLRTFFCKNGGTYNRVEAACQIHVGRYTGN